MYIITDVVRVESVSVVAIDSRESTGAIADKVVAFGYSKFALLEDGAVGRLVNGLFKSLFSRGLKEWFPVL